MWQLLWNGSKLALHCRRDKIQTGRQTGRASLCGSCSRMGRNWPYIAGETRYRQAGRQAGPVYVAAALEWVEIGPTLQERRDTDRQTDRQGQFMWQLLWNGSKLALHCRTDVEVVTCFNLQY